MPKKSALIAEEQIEQTILLIRGHKVMLDAALAQLYGVKTKELNKAVKRNAERFPPDFVFQLTSEEAESLRFQFGTSNSPSPLGAFTGRGGRRYLPYVFTEQGVAMLSSVLRSTRAGEAIQVKVLDHVIIGNNNYISLLDESE